MGRLLFWGFFLLTFSIFFHFNFSQPSIQNTCIYFFLSKHNTQTKKNNLFKYVQKTIFAATITSCPVIVLILKATDENLKEIWRKLTLKILFHLLIYILNNFWKNLGFPRSILRSCKIIKFLLVGWCTFLVLWSRF